MRTNPVTAVRCLAILALTLAVSAAAQAPPPAGPGEPEATALALQATAQAAAARDHAFDLVRSLTFEAGPRFAGSPGLDAGIAWAVRTLGQLGLENVHTEPVTVPHWVREAESGAIVSPFPQPMHLTALGGSVATPPGGVTAEVVEVPSLEALEKLADDDARGRIVFVDEVMERTRDGRGYGTAVAVRGIGASEAAKKGAVALLIRSVGTGTHRFPHTGALHYEKGAPKIPAAALAIPDADILDGQLAIARERPQERPVRFHLELVTRTEEPRPSANVVGEIRGREKPDEIVVLGAHLDSWDLGTGAIDDGAGCAIVLEAAHLIAQLPRRPRRTVRVVLFANEEFGLSGAHAYARAHAEELAHHVLAAESDLGADRIWRFGLKTSAAGMAVGERLAALLSPLGIAWAGELGFGGSDVAPMRAGGVPIAALGQDATTYFDYHHTADDTVDKVDHEGLAQNVAAYATLAWFAAEVPETFGRAPAVTAAEE